MTYYVYDNTTRELLETSETVIDPAKWAGMAYGETALTLAEITASYNWSGIAQDFVPKGSKRSKLEFLQLFTSAERIGVKAETATDPIVDDFWTLMMLADTIHLDSADTQAGIGYLVYKGLITQARADEILTY